MEERHVVVFRGATAMMGKRAPARVVARWLIGIVLIYSGVYALYWICDVGNLDHKQGTRGMYLMRAYHFLCTYRERNGRWPPSLKVMVKQPYALDYQSCIFDPISHGPVLYYPNAEAGTSAIILAQPEPLKAGLWPFITTHRWGVRADGRIVNLHDDESELGDPR
ncbi:MAG: hypothetical protein ABSG68_06640 [Thermoguttaceae bacterium]|jgi:hypothetical protein